MDKTILLTIRNWKGRKKFIAYTSELNIASQGKTEEEANKKLKEAVDLFIENAKKRGVLDEILEESCLIAKEKTAEPLISFYPLKVKV